MKKLFRCSHLLTNPIALRLVLKITLSHKVQLPSVTNIILVGERAPNELITSISQQLENVKTINVP